jgi:hypothetical protein
MFPEVQILSDVAVSPNLAVNDPGVTCAYPLPCRLADGSLVCSYRRGREKHSRDGVLVCQRSRDEGRVWEGPVEVFDGPRNREPESVHAGSIVQDHRGNLLAIFTAVEVKDPEAYIFSPEGQKLDQRLYLACSPDAGQTWSPPRRFRVGATPRQVYVGSRPLLLASGEVFLPLEATADDAQVLLGTFSADGGASWLPAIPCAADPSGAVSYGDARCAVLPDGRIVMLAWTWETPTEYAMSIHQTISHDHGRTWSPPAPTGLAAQVTAVGALGGDLLVGVGNVREPPQGIRLWFGEVGGGAWQTDRPVAMWDQSTERMVGAPLDSAAVQRAISPQALWAALPGYTFGTPDLVALGESRFLLTYYATIRGITHVRACVFRVAGIPGAS